MFTLVFILASLLFSNNTMAEEQVHLFVNSTFNRVGVSQGAESNFSYTVTPERFIDLFRNPERAREKSLNEYFTKTFEKKVREFLNSPSYQSFYEPKGSPYRQIIQELIAKGLFEDIKKTKFQFENKCFDSNGESKEAAAQKDKPGTPICFSAKTFLKSGSSDEAETRTRLLALGIHEFAHHFGYMDADHSLYGFILKAASIFENYSSAEFQRVLVNKSYAEARSAFESGLPVIDGEFLPEKIQCAVSVIGSSYETQEEKSSVLEFKRDLFLPDRPSFTLHDKNVSLFKARNGDLQALSKDLSGRHWSVSIRRGFRNSSWVMEYSTEDSSLSVKALSPISKLLPYAYAICEDLK